MRKFLVNMLQIKSPYADANLTDPLFYVHAKQVRGAESVEALRKSTRRIGLIIGGIGLLGFAIISIDVVNQFAVEWLALALLGITAVEFALTVIFDFFYAMYGVSSLRSLLNPEMLDLLRVSIVKPEDIIKARLHIARLYAWRLFMVIFMSRCVVVVLWMPFAAYASVELFQESAYISLTEILAILGFLTGIVLSTIYFFIYEPYWRYQTVTAIGLRQGAQHPRTTGIVTWSVITLIGFWIFQAGAWGVGGYILWIFGMIFVTPLESILSGADFAGIGIVVWVIAFLIGCLGLAFSLLIRASQTDFVRANVINGSIRSFSKLDEQ